MTLRRFFKYSLAGLMVFLALYFTTVTTGRRPYRQLAKSLGILRSDEEPLLFMTRSIRPGMTHSEVAKIVRGYSGRETLPPDQYSRGGTDVYIYDSLAFGRWKWFGEYGRIWVAYDADGRVRDAQTYVGD